MLQDRLKNLFKNYDPAVRQVIYEVGEIEQQFISMERPRGIYDKIGEVISRIAEEELKRQEEKG
ncbi:MAG TPA: hypothetical protein EYH05_09630, partial [Anaerolineae bacterium]|nr:hypothetical protein [Anaerolineae bacterium]